MQDRNASHHIPRQRLLESCEALEKYALLVQEYEEEHDGEHPTHGPERLLNRTTDVVSNLLALALGSLELVAEYDDEGEDPMAVLEVVHHLVGATAAAVHARHTLYGCGCPACFDGAELT